MTFLENLASASLVLTAGLVGYLLGYFEKHFN